MMQSRPSLLIPRNAMTCPEQSHLRDAKRQNSASIRERPRKKVKTLLGDDSDDGASGSGEIPLEEGGNSSGSHILAVNQEYAQRFEYNKTREELQRRVYNASHLAHKSLS